VEISGNQARADGGGVFLNDITSTLTNVKITDNIAQGNGGAFYANAPDHTFISNLTGYPLLLISTKLTNVEITGNQAYKGFGFYAEEFDVEELSLRNVTLADNAGTQDGASGDVYLANGVATFYNSIVDGDVQGEEYAANAYNTLSSYAAWANATDEGVVNYVLNEGDSVFAKGSYALAADSVARDKGDNAYVPETLTTDLAGNPRVVNGTVDLGAYEGSEAASTVVTITADVVDAYDGEISLREALAYAKSGETVSFAEDLRGQTITLKGEELKIAKALTIQGLVDETGAPQITIDADGKSRVFNVAAGNARKPVSISGLKLTGGNATNGGAVYVAWTKTANFTNVIFTGNTATNYGGAVYVDGTANFENATLSGNQASFGAAARVAGTATFTNNVISENNATSYGGGVFVGKSGSAEFEGNEISGNTAAKYGGGVYVNGTATFLNDEIVGNTANRNGGGLYVAGTATLTGATIAENQAANGAGAYVLNGGNVDFKNGRLVNNEATNGGAVYVAGTANFEGTAFDGNKASYSGGVAYVANGGTANFESATLSGNQANYGAVARVDGIATFTNNVISENNATSYGGGVFVGKSGSAEFEGNKISGNTATKYGGGGVYVNGTATFLNDEIVGNTANRNGGGLYVAGTATLT
ncbi:MAG: hypothetical protein IKK39_05620, partial [Thermoguttaceae bacterium]|nr:hypothetical protein [Thermoguttaceae bacterium]